MSYELKTLPLLVRGCPQLGVLHLSTTVLFVLSGGLALADAAVVDSQTRVLFCGVF